MENADQVIKVTHQKSPVMMVVFSVQYFRVCGLALSKSEMHKAICDVARSVPTWRHALRAFLRQGR